MRFDDPIRLAVPIIQPLLTRELILSAELAAAGVATPLPAKDLETILIELVGNSVCHSQGASEIVIRSRIVGATAWLLVSDNGGPSRQRIVTKAHGHGLGRIARLVAGAGGEMRQHRRKKGGLVVGISLPAVAKERVIKPQARRSVTVKTILENRQPIAA